MVTCWSPGVKSADLQYYRVRRSPLMKYRGCSQHPTISGLKALTVSDPIKFAPLFQEVWSAAWSREYILWYRTKGFYSTFFQVWNKDSHLYSVDLKGLNWFLKALPLLDVRYVSQWMHNIYNIFMFPNGRCIFWGLPFKYRHSNILPFSISPAPQVFSWHIQAILSPVMAWEYCCIWMTGSYVVHLGADISTYTSQIEAGCYVEKNLLWN